MYERRKDRLVPFPIFLKRVAGSSALAAIVMLVSLAIGVLGYHGLAGLAWIDSLLNAAMILGGMGPVDHLDGVGAKVFAAAYALYGGLVLIAAMGIALSPVLHRVLHQFHVDDVELKAADRRGRT
ncbi:MAG TPA: hypothetical protein VK348_00545 [Planctomycetota bacterium]|nr:hypothetical protein [Planctomycetota bacterium]